MKRNPPPKLSLWDKLKLLRLLNDKTMFEKLKSRKLWATVIGAAVVTLGQQLGLSEDFITSVVTLISAYVVGQGIADAGAAKKA